MPNLTPDEWDAKASAARSPFPCASNACVDIKSTEGDLLRFTSTIDRNDGFVDYTRDEVSQFITDVKDGNWDHLLA